MTTPIILFSIFELNKQTSTDLQQFGRVGDYRFFNAGLKSFSFGMKPFDLVRASAEYEIFGSIIQVSKELDVIDNINLIYKQYEHAQHNQIYMNQGNSTFLDKTIYFGKDLMNKSVSRGAAFGDCLSNLLKINGYEVFKEYYVNDAGKQIDILTLSVLQRYHELINDEYNFQYEDLYKGDYIWDIAAEVHRNFQETFLIKDLHTQKFNLVDDYISHVKNIISKERFNEIKNLSVKFIQDNIEKTLILSGIKFDSWFLESSLLQNDNLQDVIDFLSSNNHTYQKDNALWFKSADKGDEKDRVLIKENNDHTYLATDIAYHKDKIERNYNRVINIWGADHHGYISRIKGAFNIFSKGKSDLTILLVQFANLYRGKKKVSMSTRSGDFITLEQLLKEVGKDATRFFYIARKSDQHMDFDIELAKTNDSNNPVYYIQYAHARICSIFRQSKENNMTFSYSKKCLDFLSEEEELKIIKKLYSYPDIVKKSAERYEPHLLTNYMRELAQEIHSYYNKFQILVDDNNIRNARLSLIEACRQVFENSGNIIGIKMPEKM